MSIVLSGLSKHYGKTLALDHISLTINPGIHGLLGSNGAGKTTLMRILATILNSDAGEITWGDAVNWKRPGSVKGLLGYLPQQFGMYKHLRVEEALRCVALLKDIPKEQEEAQVKLVMEQMNLEQYARRKVGQLSGGMLRRLGVAQAMLGNPKLLILDEPSVGLDPEERINLRKTIRDYAARDRIVLISSHIVSDVESLCDEVSIVMMPLADGATDTASLFEASGEHSSPLPIGFELKGVEPLEDGSLWLRYDVTGPVEQDQS